MLAMLQIDYAYNPSSAHQWNRKKGFVTVFREFMKKLEPRILRCALGNGYGLTVLGNPSGNALADAKFQAIDHLWVRILRRPQDKFIAFEHINKAGITFHEA
jgi:hypothetical protein